jgi:crotonobetainyl-CoA:carnitine CoA-transferase CaiB-like acyl-CoA transferase
VYTPPCSEFPVGQRGAFGDRISAVQLAFGVAAALFRRERTGVPSVVDTSLLASAMWSLSSDVLAALHGGPSAGLPPGGAARQAPLNPLVNTFRTQDDRFLCLSFNQSDRYWSRFCETLGEPELTGDTRFADAAARAAHSAECVAVLDRIFATRTLDEWRVLFDREQFPWAPFQRVAELIDDPQVVANGYLGEVPIGNGESLRMPTGAVQFDEMPAAIRRGPEHGQHTELILLELGLDWDEIVRLKDGGVID